MFESITYEYLNENKLKQIDDKFDKRPGSLMRTATHANSLETRMMYIDMEMIVRNMFPQTADRDHLIKHAQIFNIYPYRATATVARACFNIRLPEGSRFNSPTGDVNFRLREYEGQDPDDDLHYYLLQSENCGRLDTEPIGRLTPIDEIKGLTLAEIVSIEIPGEDEEETEKFRKRFADEKHWARYGGNVADYMAMTHTIPGVGAVKVVPTPHGVGGEVGLYLLDSEYNIPSGTLLETVKEEIDPVGFEGQGLGLAPIDHKVYVWPAEALVIDVELPITFQPGYSWETAEDQIKGAIEAYFLEVRQDWETRKQSMIYISQIETRILQALSEQILDLQNTKLNGEEANLLTKGAEVPVLGVATHA